MVFFRNLNVPGTFVLLVIAFTRTVRASVDFSHFVVTAPHAYSSRFLTKQRHSYYSHKTVHSIHAGQLHCQPTTILQPTLQLICS